MYFYILTKPSASIWKYYILTALFYFTRCTYILKTELYSWEGKRDCAAASYAAAIIGSSSSRRIVITNTIVTFEILLVVKLTSLISLIL